MAHPTHHRLPKLLALLLLACSAVGCVTGPPVQEMSNARQAIRAARDAGAAQASGEAFREAERLLQQAETRLQQGDYKAARRNAVAARSKAGEALRYAQSKATDSTG